MGTTGFDEARWRRKLGRLRLGAEPIGDQLARIRRATCALTAVASAIGLMFLGIFAAFGRADVGLVVVGVLVAPVVATSWWDDARIRARASAYLRAREAHSTNEPPPG